MPASLLRELGVPILERWPFRLADGREVEMDVGETRIRVDGRERTTVVVFAEEGTGPILGAVTLEEFRLGVDPIAQRLIPVPGLLMSSPREL
jgi:predicted aspartyl protease